ncbi:uncharacterized protein LTR77_002988 [Saxophila tyrrhenica]|uniref:Metallo-beta-lactamase domain-containing protein n=1 Tax=Saxophila tyrrhenica TaxID=1690608 RepID=A0AAV9PKE6_9PEZI|nr:hypothetical protein LTR77_002988 [Saxophila tyrrhenica]
MALTVTQLNGDTTILLTFCPAFAPEQNDKRTRFPGDYTILIDPWLSGQSSILHPTFQVSQHTVEPAIASINDIKEHIDLIIISQDKPDHCHKETLCSLSKKKQVNIIATPAAAKKIRSWGHFNPRRVLAMDPYKADRPETVVRIPLPAYTSTSASGEITIANIATKRDVTGLHNAIGITYQPPSSVFTMNTQWERYEQGTTVQLSTNGISRPQTPAQRPRTGSDTLPPPTDKKLLRKSVSFPYLPQQTPPTPAPPLPPLPAPHHQRADSGIANPTPAPNTEPLLSLLYTPHGITPHTLAPYHTTHLRSLPLTALFHSMNTEENPWFMGGRVAGGAPGGVELAKAVRAREWFGAHDEEKDNRGLATVWIKSRRFGVEEVRGMLEEKGLAGTRVWRLGCGERVRVGVA